MLRDILLDNPPILFSGHAPRIIVGQPSDKSACSKAISCTHTRFTRCPVHMQCKCHCMKFTYYMHTKELHGIFKNHSSYQSSWATTSTACNSYPYIIRIHISNTHTSACYSSSNQHAIGFFSLNPRKTEYTTHFPDHIFQQYNLFSSNTTYFPAYIFQQQPIFQFIFSSNTTYSPVHVFQQHNLFYSSYFPATQPIF